MAVRPGGGRQAASTPSTSTMGAKGFLFLCTLYRQSDGEVQGWGHGAAYYNRARHGQTVNASAFY
eukprot:CAMPEP_0180515504 /NCGR_PEP_ID=MMETSP1036_2-20121128/53363_1 /TAXON_ID=632150 /ORGANISM="Azadinium spinosum, Strain 3D9" /LENGTH=64 /DNA_ID=CAMNT_0022527127 /DNA_START=54 /DNA_END=248 /DNA_ORIENTATION=-